MRGTQSCSTLERAAASRTMTGAKVFSSPRSTALLLTGFNTRGKVDAPITSGRASISRCAGTGTATSVASLHVRSRCSAILNACRDGKTARALSGSSSGSATKAASALQWRG